MGIRKEPTRSEGPPDDNFLCFFNFLIKFTVPSVFCFYLLINPPYLCWISQSDSQAQNETFFIVLLLLWIISRTFTHDHKTVQILQIHTHTLKCYVSFLILRVSWICDKIFGISLSTRNYFSAKNYSVVMM